MMKQIKLFFFCLLFLLFTITSLSAQTTGSIGADVRAALSKYDKAWNGKDVKTVDAMLDDSYVYFSSLGGLTDRNATLEFLAKPDYKLSFVERSELVIHKYDRNVAVVSSRWKGKGSWSGGEINDDQRCGQVWIRDEKLWKLVSEHCVQIEKK